MVLEKKPGMGMKGALLAWADHFENDHYVFDVYGEQLTADVPRETVEKIIDISVEIFIKHTVSLSAGCAGFPGGSVWMISV